MIGLAPSLNSTHTNYKISGENKLVEKKIADIKSSAIQLARSHQTEILNVFSLDQNKRKMAVPLEEGTIGNDSFVVFAREGAIYLKESSRQNEETIILPAAKVICLYDNLSGLDLSDLDLSGVDLTQKDLTNTKFVGSNLKGAILVNAILNEANLGGTYMYKANLSGANISKASMIGTYLEKANMTNTVLYGAQMAGVELTDADLTGIYATWQDIEGAIGFNVVSDHPKVVELLAANAASSNGDDIREWHNTIYSAMWS